MGLTSKLEKLRLKPQDGEAIQAPGDTDDIDELDNNGQSILMGIISQLRLGADLSKITLPTFILEKKSMLERITNFFQIPEILLQADDTEDDLERFLLVLKWYLASWHIAPKAVKKPLNPILGEIFACYWDDLPDGSNAYYISEQTSHHPPKSSYFYLIPERKIRVDGTVVPRSKFLGNSSAAIMEGLGNVNLYRHKEVYSMNQPNVYCRGILFGKLRSELGDTIVVKCPKLNLEANIEFKVKGLISGAYDVIDGKITNTKTGELLFSLSGKWNNVIEIRDNKTGKESVFYDTNNSKVISPKVRPLNEQLDRESRRLWKPTIDALSERNHELATEEKAKVESSQRDLAKAMAEEGKEFEPKLFQTLDPKEKESGGLEYKLYKNFDLEQGSEELERQLFEVMPILPGQNFKDDFELPASEKA